MYNKLFDKEVSEVVLVFKWITAKHFRLCHALTIALGWKGGGSFGVVAPGPDTNQEMQVLTILYRENRWQKCILLIQFTIL